VKEQTKRSIEQNREPRNRPTKVQLILDKRADATQQSKESSQQVVWDKGTATSKTITLDTDLGLFTKK
jgi:hypothetical protein